MVNSDTLILSVMIYLSGYYFSNAQTSDTFTDSRDLMVYKTVNIGKQIWMAENLNYQIKDSWTYQNLIDNESVYGRLYSWDAAVQACPPGWHLPSDPEWKELEIRLGMTENEADKFNLWRGTNKGNLLLSDSLLNFKVLMGGYRNPPANFNLIGLHAFFWTSTTEYDLAWMRQFYSQETRIFRKTRPKSWAFSVRCVKD